MRNQNQNGQNWEPAAGEGDAWDNNACPPAHNSSWNNHPPSRNVPPWQQHHQQHSQYQNNYWQDANNPDNLVQQAPWNADFKEPYQRNPYANFNRVAGPVRKNLKFGTNRTRPY